MKWPVERVHVGVILLLSVFVGLLDYQNRALKQRVGVLVEALYRGPGEQLQPGDYVMELRLTALDGEPTVYSYSLGSGGNDVGQNSLIAFLQPNCGYCADEVDKWNQLADNGRFADEIIGVSLGALEDTEHFIATTGIRFPVFLGDPSLREQLRLPGTPVLVRVSSTGRIEDVIVGAGGDVASLSEWYGVSADEP